MTSAAVVSLVLAVEIEDAWLRSVWCPAAAAIWVSRVAFSAIKSSPLSIDKLFRRSNRPFMLLSRLPLRCSGSLAVGAGLWWLWLNRGGALYWSGVGRIPPAAARPSVSMSSTWFARNGVLWWWSINDGTSWYFASPNTTLLDPSSANMILKWAIVPPSLTRRESWPYLYKENNKR